MGRRGALFAERPMLLAARVNFLWPPDGHALMRAFIISDENGRTSGSWGTIGALIQIKDGSLSVRDDR